MTTVVQKTYRPQIAPFVVGQVVDEASAEIQSRQVETSAGIGFGLAVSQGTKDKGCIIAGSAFVGVTVRDVTLDRLPIDPLSTSSSPGTVDTYQQYANAAVLTRGHVAVTANGGGDGGVKANDALYYDTTTGTFTNSSSGSAAAGTATFTQQPADGDTLVITTSGADTWTFKSSGGNSQSSKYIAILGTLGDTIANAAAVLEAATATNTELLTYKAWPPSPGGVGEGSGSYVLMYAAEAVGTAANSYTVASNTTGTTVTGTSGALAGGTASATAVTGGIWRTSAIAGDVAVISLGIQK
jgi:hypothetical protein